MNPYKLTGTPEGDQLCNGRGSLASAAALTMAALTPNYDPPTAAAEATLGQLSCELTCLAELLNKGTDLDSEFLTTWVRGMAQRADVAVELAARVRRANSSHVEAEAAQ